VEIELRATGLNFKDVLNALASTLVMRVRSAARALIRLGVGAA
jgi:hypothetical protein